MKATILSIRISIGCKKRREEMVITFLYSARFPKKPDPLKSRDGKPRV
jgi:hypothetical protein